MLNQRGELVGSGRAKPRDTANDCAYVIVSGYHDYRSRRKVDLHFVADNLKHRGGVLFLSLRFSALSRFKEDPRHDLLDRANRLERVNDVLCYLHRTPVHPIGLPHFLRAAERASFKLYASYLPSAMRRRIAGARTIFIESGIAITFVPLLRRLNRSAEIVYLASDSLQAIGQADTVRRDLRRHARSISRARVPSPFLASDVPSTIPSFFIPHGIDKGAYSRVGPSPYDRATRNAVSVGSMLFDPTFFAIAGAAFPDIAFHVIGSGHAKQGPSNVVYHPEMPFEETLAYLRHSTFAIAAYGPGVERYLTHTSMKLMQYHYLGIPAVCPDLVASPEFGRFGYQHGNEASIRQAITAALSASSIARGAYLDWKEVTDRLIAPLDFPDTRCFIDVGL